MVSDIQTLSNGGQVQTSVLSIPERPKVAVPTAPSGPKVIAPKENDIKFDPIEAKHTLQSAVNMLNEQMASTKQGLGFSYDHTIKRPVITVRNTASGDVVRQIPCEDLLACPQIR